MYTKGFDSTLCRVPEPARGGVVVEARECFARSKIVSEKSGKGCFGSKKMMTMALLAAQ